MTVPNNRYRVLVVAPFCPATHLVLWALRSDGLKVDLARSLQEALARMDFMPYDVVVAHEHLSGEHTGYITELTDFVYRRHRATAFVTTAGCASISAEHRCGEGTFRVCHQRSLGENLEAGEHVAQRIARAVTTFLSPADTSEHSNDPNARGSRCT